MHDIFNMLNVLIFLPLNWIYPFLEKMTYEMAKDQKPCEGDKCKKTEFLKPYISPYSKGVANYDKKVAGYISENWCAGQCGKSYSTDAMKLISAEVCTSTTDCSNVHKNYESNWMSKGYLAKKRAPAYIVGTASGPAEFHYSKPASCSTSTKFFNDEDAWTSTVAGSLAAGSCYEVCGSKVKTGLCEKRLLKGGLLLDEWEMTDNGAGTFLTIVSLIALCSCLFCIVYMLQIIMKGAAARVLQKVVGFNGYLNIAIGCFITIMVQSSSITTSTLTPSRPWVSFPSTICFPSPSAPTSAPPSPASCPPPSSPPTPSTAGKLRLLTSSSTSLVPSSGIPSPRFVRFPSRLPGSSATALPTPSTAPFSPSPTFACASSSSPASRTASPLRKHLSSMTNSTR